MIEPTFSHSNAKNDYREKYTMHASHNHIEEHSDGSKDQVQREVESLYDSYCIGGKWIYKPDKPKCSDPADAHFRRDKRFTCHREKSVKQDKNGNRTTDEKAAKSEDGFTIHGTAGIIDSPEESQDNRGSILENFSSGSDPFKQLGTNNQLLIGGE